MGLSHFFMEFPLKEKEEIAFVVQCISKGIRCRGRACTWLSMHCIGALDMLSSVYLGLGQSSIVLTALFLAVLRMSRNKSPVSFVNPAFQTQRDLWLKEGKRVIFITPVLYACL